MNKRISKIVSLAIALLMLMVMAAPALAADYVMKNPLTQADAEFDKYLVMDQKAVVPNTTFTFTVEPGAESGDGATAEDTTFPVFKGIMKGLVITSTSDSTGKTIATEVASETITIAFGANNGTGAVSATNNSKQTGDGVNLEANEKYAKGVIKLDFSGVTFKEPGVYRYKITEAANSDGGIKNDSNTVRYLDVYVMDVTTNGGALTLDVTGYTLTTEANALVRGSENGTAGDVGDTPRYNNKSEGFENDYSSYDLQVNKTVTGNQGNKNKDFTFTVKITDATPGTYKVTYLPTGTASGGTTGKPDEIVVGTDKTNGATGTDIKLKHGESFIIENLSSGAKYTVSENAEDYLPSYTATEKGTGAVTDGVPSDKTTTAQPGPEADTYDNTDGIQGDTTVTFTNERNGTIPTGVLLTIAPFVALMVVGVFGAVIVLKKKKN